jgi:hypothetical protein
MAVYFHLDVSAVWLMSVWMTRNPNPKTLDDLLANARDYAEYCMRGTGNMPPTLFLVGSDGKQIMFMPENLADVQAKDNFAQMSKLMAVATGATIAVMAMEAWLKTGKVGEKMDMTEPPSEAFDRQECIVLMGESMAEGQKQQMLPITGHKRFPPWRCAASPNRKCLFFLNCPSRFALPPRAWRVECRRIVRQQHKTQGIRTSGGHYISLNSASTAFTAFTTAQNQGYQSQEAGFTFQV